jgi:ligand-binding SRPBCC domain-containing protein
MTVLENSIRINASPEKVWSVLASLEALERYDPGIKKSEIVSASREGSGSARKCDLAPGGWFKEKVADWRPYESLSFELFECSLPLRRLKHSYKLIPDGGATLVRQRMEYELKFGPVGKLMDAMMVRKKWDAGIKAFFAGLKRYVETDGPSSDENNGVVDSASRTTFF